jgi:Gram-negative porin
MRRIDYSVLLTLLLIAVDCESAAADSVDELGSNVSVAGYGTIGGLYHDQKGIEYRRDERQGRGAEAGELDFATDSRLGLQLNVKLGSTLEAVLQEEAAFYTEGNIRPQINLGLLKFSPNDNLTLRAGRLGADIYMTADTRGVGYSWMMIRPPIEVFGIISAQRFDGGDLVLAMDLGDDQRVEAKLFAGSLRGKLVGDDLSSFNLDGSHVVGGHLQYSHGGLDIRLGAARVRFAHESPAAPLQDALRHLGTIEAANAADALSYENRAFEFYTLGVLYSAESLQSQLLYSHSRTSAPGIDVPDVAMFSIGNRFGSLTPYAGYSAAWNDRPRLQTGIPSSASPQVAQLNAAVELATEMVRDRQSSIAAGLRYDLMPRIALKGQIDRVHVTDSAVLLLTTTEPLRDRSFWVYSMAVDFIF